MEEAISGCKKQFSVNVPGKPKADTIILNIPAGTSDNTNMKLRGRGRPGPNGQNGDLNINIRIEPHEYFKLKDSDIIIEVAVTFTEAVFGAKVLIPTPDGKKIRISIPQGCKNESRLTIKGKGLIKNGIKGNLIAIIKIDVPTNLTDKQTNVLKKYAKIEEKGVRP